GAAHDDVAHRGELPRRGALLRADRRRPAVPRPRRPELDQLGHDALLVAEPAGAAERQSTVVDRARPLRRAARCVLRADELRVRRDQQPGSSSRKEGPCPAGGFSRYVTCGSSTPPPARRCGRWTASTWTCTRASSSA